MALSAPPETTVKLRSLPSCTTAEEVWASRERNSIGRKIEQLISGFNEVNGTAISLTDIEQLWDGQPLTSLDASTTIHHISYFLEQSLRQLTIEVNCTAVDGKQTVSLADERPSSLHVLAEEGEGALRIHTMAVATQNAIGHLLKKAHEQSLLKLNTQPTQKECLPTVDADPSFWVRVVSSCSPEILATEIGRLDQLPRYKAISEIKKLAVMGDPALKASKQEWKERCPDISVAVADLANPKNAEHLPAFLAVCKAAIARVEITSFATNHIHEITELDAEDASCAWLHSATPLALATYFRDKLSVANRAVAFAHLIEITGKRRGTIAEEIPGITPGGVYVYFAGTGETLDKLTTIFIHFQQAIATPDEEVSTRIPQAAIDLNHADPDYGWLAANTPTELATHFAEQLSREERRIAFGILLAAAACDPADILDGGGVIAGHLDGNRKNADSLKRIFVSFKQRLRTASP